MRKTPPDVEINIIARLLNCESYESVTEGRVSKSTVNRIVNTFQKKCPDFWDLREFNIRRKKANIAMIDVLQNVEDATSATPPIAKYIIENLGSPAAQYLDQLLESECTYIPCKGCGNYFQIQLEPAQSYEKSIQIGNNCFYKCANCGFIAPYSPFDILGYLGLTLLKKNDNP
jgi:hypothetical protein